MKTLMFVMALVAPQEPPKTADNSEQMKKFEWLIGTWTGSGEMEGLGKFEEEARYEWTLNRNFIKVEMWSRAGGKVVYHATGMIGYDCEKKKFVGFGFGMDGTIGWSEEVKSDAPETFAWEGRNSGPAGAAKCRHSMTKVDADTHRMRFEHEVDSKWASMCPDVTMKRKKELK